MKLKIISFLTPAVLAVALLPQHAEGATTLLVGGSTRNGDFQTGSSDIAFDTWVPYPGTATKQRTNSAGAQNFYSPTDSGNYAGVVGRNSSNVAITLGISSGYQIETGDIFKLTFDYRAGFQNTTGDGFAWNLFYTANNAIDGTATSLASGTVSLNGTGSLGDGAGDYGSLDHTTAAAAAAADGKTLFFALTNSAGSGTSARYGLVDNVTLTLIPEPSAAMLLGSLGVLALLRRRRA